MAKKSSRAAGRSVAAGGEGAMAALVDRIFENPANSGGLVVVALTATAIVSNAMFLQPTHRSAFAPARTAPLSSTASPPAARAQQDAMPTPPLPRPSPARLQQQPIQQQAAPPAPPTATVPIAPSAPPAAKPADQAALITAVQRHLAELGLYTGAIDGKSGPRTAAAISAYETAAGLAPTGKATAALLATMQAPLPAAPITPAPVAPVTAAPAGPIAGVSGQQLDQRADARQAAIEAEQKERAEAQMHADTRMAQQALNNIGYGPLVVNGQPDAETADAIRRFELDSGMPLTGQANADLIQRLKAIGAIQQPG
ncbi:MAG TPA: peptidoglycan-binding domain-containing protein [Bauldia sp.]|nr:peptidoglycan-binding domain-containing protein [Bauldia sp.]